MLSFTWWWQDLLAACIMHVFAIPLLIILECPESKEKYFSLPSIYISSRCGFSEIYSRCPGIAGYPYKTFQSWIISLYLPLQWPQVFWQYSVLWNSAPWSIQGHTQYTWSISSLEGLPANPLIQLTPNFTKLRVNEQIWIPLAAAHIVHAFSAVQSSTVLCPLLQEKYGTTREPHMTLCLSWLFAHTRFPDILHRKSKYNLIKCNTLLTTMPASFWNIVETCKWKKSKQA